MPVLVEASSIIIRCDSIHEKYHNGWMQFETDVPNRTLCSDNEIVRVGFMAEYDARQYVIMLEKCGLQFMARGKSVDIALVDQQRGIISPCDWLEFDHSDLSAGENVAYCRHVSSVCKQIVTPERWKYNGSLSQNYCFAPDATADKCLKFLRHENGLDVYFDRLAGKNVYVGRVAR